MPIEEQAEEKIQNAVQSIITGGARLMLRIPKGVAMAMLRSGMKLAKTGVHAAGAAVKDGIDSGEMSEKRLQRKKDGDLHELQLDDSTMREVQRSLKQAGIDYHLERTDRGRFILHFAGRDEDHVRHAVQRAFKNMGLDVADEDFAVEQTEQQERTTEQTRSEPETPTRETPATEPENQPEPTPAEAQAQAEKQQTQARADNPKPAGKERKPIRSKKALLERFKTRLNENLAEQKNHMPPTQNRDRTPRKGR